MEGSSFRILIVAAFIAGLLFRFTGLSNPPFDAHSFRQSQTLSTIDAFYLHGIDIFHARAIYMGYPGTFVLELPVFQALAALLYHVLGPHVEIVRILNIIFGMMTTWLLYRVIWHLLERPTAILSALIYWLAPLNAFYQRSTLIDPLAVCCAMLSFYCMALLLNPTSAGSSGENGHARWLAILGFAIGTWFAAMIKALYLWPSVLLFGQAVLTRRFKIDPQLVKVFTIMAISGLCFLAWNYYASRVNARSIITRGIEPTALLGVSSLLDPSFYFEQIVRRPRWWLSTAGALLYPFGIYALWAERRPRAAVLLLLALVPPTYLLLFATINGHDYYQLIITPFLAVISANGLRWLALTILGPLCASAPARRLILEGSCWLLLLSAVLTFAFWFHHGRLDAQTLHFQKLCAGRFEPWAPAMVFISESVNGDKESRDIPHYLYAAKLWGTGKSVRDQAEAHAFFEQLRPAYKELEYVVLYGTQLPDWVPSPEFKLEVRDPADRLWVFKR